VLPWEITQRHQIIPLDFDQETVVLASTRALSALAITEVKAVSSLTPTVVIFEHNTFEIFSTAYKQSMFYAPSSGNRSSIRATDTSEEESGRETVRLTEGIISAAWQRRASDIHFEPQRNGLLVRFRIDGVLQEYTFIGSDRSVALVARLKILAQMDVSQKFEPQDGHLELTVEDRVMQMRAATIPVIHGEKIVLRFLYREVIELTLGQLGMTPESVAGIQSLLSRPHGLLLVTGPTGSGKTTTLYPALNFLRSSTRNITSIEDPIEYEFNGINQIAVSAARGLTFARGLRGILRQDPDVIMVGEIRDRETADVALRAAITGRLVLSSLHTNDAYGAILRLLDMEIEPFIVTAAVAGVVGQRLVRQLCPRCKVYCNIEETPWAEINALAIPGIPWKVAEAKGCEFCHGTGYSGRSGIFEIMIMDEDLQKLIMKKPDASMVSHYFRSKGWQPTMLQDGWRQILAHKTDIAELVRVLYI